MPKILISLPSGDISQELTGDVVTIGRTSDNKIQINHHSVSAHHAKLFLTNGNYKIKDLDSTNRTFVNNIPINEADLTSSCFLRFGTIECVYKCESSNANDQMQSKLSELQRQIENLMKARDVISLQNQTLTKERDEARLAAETANDELAEAKREIAAFTNQNAGNQQFHDISAKLAETQKRLEIVTRERNGLMESTQKLGAQVEELQKKLQTAATVAQKRDTNLVREQIAESVSEYEEEAIGQRTATAGNSSGRISLSGAPLLSSWLNRGGGKSAAFAEPTDKPNNITSMPLPPVGKNGTSTTPISLATTPAPAVTSATLPLPVLRIIPPPPSQSSPSTGGPLSSGVRQAKIAANAAPQNPEIKPAWELLNTMRRSLHYFLRHQEDSKLLEEMSQNARSLTEMTQSKLLRPVLELATALEALIRDLHANPRNINASTLRTVGQSIDFLATLIDEANLSRLRHIADAKVFAIDDDQGILDTISATMETAHLQVTTSSQSNAGLKTLSEGKYDLILLDVGLPEMNGMDICSRVRAMPHHEKTPIVFLTGEATVQNRVQSTLNGGNDLIGKPFSVLELAVKVLTWIFKGQLGLV
jgi:CheY-like chemotaxis protein